MSRMSLKSVIERATKEVPLVSPEDTISDIKKMLFAKIKEMETINYVYVVDKENKLQGVFSIKEIFMQPDSAKTRDFMKTKIFKIQPETHQEEAAILALKHNLKAIPVTDSDNFFMGVVPSDTILSILHAENVEDFLLSAGIRSPLIKLQESTSWFLAKAKIPWLILGLFGGIFGASIVELFEAPLKSHFILAAFIPLMVYIADAVGSQTQTLFIRGSILDARMDVGKHLTKEMKASAIIGLILGTLLFLISLLCFRVPYFIGIILISSLFLTILWATAIGILIPILMKKIKKDPAVGAGPFATIIRDVSSLLIYFLIASVLLEFFQ